MLSGGGSFALARLLPPPSFFFGFFAVMARALPPVGTRRGGGASAEDWRARVYRRPSLTSARLAAWLAVRARFEELACTPGPTRCAKDQAKVPNALAAPAFAPGPPVFRSISCQL